MDDRSSTSCGVTMVAMDEFTGSRGRYDSTLPPPARVKNNNNPETQSSEQGLSLGREDADVHERMGPIQRARGLTGSRRACLTRNEL